MLRDCFCKVQPYFSTKYKEYSLLSLGKNTFYTILIILFVVTNLFMALSLSGQNNISISFDAEADKDILYQVFYTTKIDMTFGGSNEVSKNVPAGASHVEMKIPTDKITRFRLDLGSYPGRVIIKNLKIKGFNSVTIDDVKALKFNQMKGVEKEKGIFEFYSNQRDPYFVYEHDLNLSNRYMDFFVCSVWILLFILFLHKILCRMYTYWQKKGLKVITKKNIISFFTNINFKDTFLVSSFLLLYLIIYMEPSLTAPVGTFERVIGQGVVNNFDINLIIKKFYLFFAEIGVCYIIISALFSQLYGHLSEIDVTKSIKSELDNLCIIGICYTILCYLSGAQFDEAMIKNIMNLILLFFISKIFLHFSGINISSDRFNTFLYSALCFSVYILLVFFTGNTNIVSITTKIVCAFLLVCYSFPCVIKSLSQYKFNTFTALLLCIPLYTSLFFETMFILNNQGFFISQILQIYAISVIVILDLGLLNDIINKTIFDVTKLYPVTVVGFALLSVQMPLVSYLGAHIFESANSSISLSSFFYNGELPILHHFGAHMLQDIVSNIFYGFLNNDYYGAIFAPFGNYLYIPFIMYMFYYMTLLVTKNKNLSLLVSLLLPVTDCVVRPYFSFGLLVIPFIYNYVRKPSYLNAALIMISCIFVFFYRIDIGVSFIIAGGIALLWATDSKNFLFRLIVAGMVTLVSIAILYFIVCVTYNINPFERLQEFGLIASSNQNWAYRRIFHDGDEINFNLFYLLLPIFIICSVLYIMLSGKSLTTDRALKVVIITLGIAYIVNFQRGLVRHNLLEKTVMVLMWSGYIYLIYFLTILYKSKKIFVPLIIMVILTEPLFLNKPINIHTILTQSIYKISTIHSDIITAQNYAKNKKVIERVKIKTNIYDLKQSMKKIMDTILTPKETYIDFTNHSFLYSLLQRRSPVYVSQSPGLLSGEKSQEFFIKEIEAGINEIPVALMSFKQEYLAIDLDGIKNNMRYYKVAEFIYQNYRPLFRNDSYVFWVKNDRYEQIKAKAKKLSAIEFIDVMYSNEYSFFYSYIMSDLAYLWGSLDEQNAKDNKIIRAVSSDNKVKYDFTPLNTQEKSKGNYVQIRIDSPIDGIGVLYFGDETNAKLRKFTFNLKGGINNYLIRVSADSLWYFLNINNLTLELPNDYKVLKINILEGD